MCAGDQKPILNAGDRYFEIGLRKIARQAQARGHTFLSYLVEMALNEAVQIAAGNPTVIDDPQEQIGVAKLKAAIANCH